MPHHSGRHSLFTNGIVSQISLITYLILAIMSTIMFTFLDNMLHRPEHHSKSWRVRDYVCSFSQFCQEVE